MDFLPQAPIPEPPLPQQKTATRLTLFWFSLARFSSLGKVRYEADRRPTFYVAVHLSVGK